MGPFARHLHGHDLYLSGLPSGHGNRAKPTIDAIREYYGNAAATFVGLVTFFACVCFNVGNVAGIGAGMSLIFGIDWKIGAAIVMVFVFLCYFLKGVYGKIEKAVTVCIAVMAIAFIVVLVMTGGPDAGATVAGLTQWQFPEGSLVTVLGFLGSSASVLAVCTAPTWALRRSGRSRTSSTASWFPTLLLRFLAPSSSPASSSSWAPSC